MEIEEKNSEEIESEINRNISEMESKYRWKQCSYKGKEFLIPDTTAALGHDVFETHRFACRDPDPNLTVLAYPMRYRNNPTLAHLYSKRMPYGMVSAGYPMRYRNNPTLAHLYSKRMPYGMVSAGYSIRIGMIENGEVKDGE